MKLNNKAYDVLKWIAMYLLPGLATLWLTLGKVWSLPYTTEIGATISAVDVFLAFIIGLSKKNYKGDGTMVVNTTDPEKDVYRFEFDGNVAELADKKTVTFVVKPEDK